MSDTILRLPEVKALTGLSRSSIYLMMSRNKFPRPVLLGERAVGWVSSEISGWLAQKIVERG